MTTSNVDFGAAVDDWCKQTTDRMERVFRASAQELASIASNGVPVDTGFARASFQVSTESMPQIDPGATNKDKTPVSFDFGEITATIANATLGQTIYMGWTAAYIGPLEYGHSQQAPQGFARLAAAQWQDIVSGVISNAKSLAG